MTSNGKSLDEKTILRKLLLKSLISLKVEINSWNPFLRSSFALFLTVKSYSPTKPLLKGK